jgi:multidrug resistance efflux pump
MPAKTTRSASRLDDLFDRLRIKPLSLVVFLASVGVLVFMVQHRTTMIHAPAVGYARSVDHTPDLESEVIATVEAVHVQVGDKVAAGAPLVTLSSRALKRALAEVDAEIAMIQAQAEVEAGELAAEEEERAREARTDAAKARHDLALARAEAARQTRLAAGATSQLDEVSGRVKAGVSPVDTLREAQWTAEGERTGAEQAAAVARAAGALDGDLQKAVKALEGRGSLADALRRAKAAEVGLLRTRREGLVEDLSHLTISATIAGRVKSILQQGASVNMEDSVATVVPLVASELVAYVPPEKSLVGLTEGTPVYVRGGCTGDSKVLRLGGGVVQAPEQLSNLLGRAFSARVLYGMPVRVAVPEGCAYGVGEALTIDLPETSR